MSRQARVSLALLIGVCGCASRPPAVAPDFADPVWTDSMAVAAEAFAAHDYGRAAQSYLVALQRARATDAALRIEHSASNAAVCLIRIGELAAAEPLLVEARRAATSNGRPTTAIDLLAARVLRGAGDTGAATALLDRIGPDGLGPVEAAEWRILRAGLDLDAGDAERARSRLGEVPRTIASPPHLEVERLDLVARLALAEGLYAEAAETREQQMDLLREDRAGGLGAVSVKVAEAWALAGERERAAEAYYRAARIAVGSGQLERAVSLIRTGLGLARDGGDADLVASFEALGRAFPLGTQKPQPAGADGTISR